MSKTEVSLNEMLSKAIDFYTNLKTNGINYFQKIKERLKKSMEILKEENKEKEVNTSECIELRNQIKFFMFENMKASLTNLEKEIRDLLSKNIIPAYFNKLFVEYDKFLSRDDSIYYGKGNLDEHLYCFKNGTKTLFEFNTITLKTTEVEININELQGSLSPLCTVPNNKLFHAGSYQPYLDSTYLIDLNTFTVESLPKGRIRGVATATYYDKCVYTFGGLTKKGNKMNFADKFDLENKRWVTLANLPEVAQDVHAIPCRTFIILTFTSQSSLLSYFRDFNKYEALANNISCNFQNMFIRDCEKYYLIAVKHLLIYYYNNL